MSTMQTPRTVPDGSFRVGINLAGAGRDTGGNGLPSFELNVRVGVGEDVDVGVKLFPVGAEVGIKYLAHRGIIDVALAPSVSAGIGDRPFALQLPILFGLDIGDRVTLAFGPKLMLWTGEAGTAFYAGYFVSIPLRIGSAFWIAPEMNMYFHTAGDQDSFVDDCGDFGICDAGFMPELIHAGLTFFFGGSEQTAEPSQAPSAAPTSPAPYVPMGY